MGKVYKVWIDIEEIDEDEGHYVDLEMPMSTRTEYNTLEEAQATQQEIVERFEGWEPVVWKSRLDK